MSLFRLLCLFSMCKVYYAEIQDSSHWMVTESGLIQPRLDSPFEMSRPYDLLSFLNQEKRWDGIFDLYKDLSKRQTTIDKLWGDVLKYTTIGRQIAHNEVCTKAGNLNVIDWYAGLLEDGSKKIHPDEFELPSTYYGPNIDIPDCKKMSSLAFSMFAFEHLESMIQRENLSANPEFVLPELISPIMTIDQYGHWLAVMLRQNSSSWLHYNMASLYWRVRGSAPKAIECSRRALYYAPREYKDIALGSLGVVLHRSDKTKDAIIVLNAAIEHDRTNYVSHFTIANAYTTVENFNMSLKYYDETIKLNPRMELAQKYKYCVMCYTELIVRIKAIRGILKKLLEELIEYERKEVAWPRMQAEFLRTIKSAEEFDYKNVEKNNERMAVITGLNIKEFRALVEKNSLIKYFIDGFPLNNEEKPLKPGIDVIDIIYGLERLIEHVNIRDNFPDITFQDGKLEHDPKFFDRNKPEKQRDGRNTARSKQQPASVADDESTEYETGNFMYPPTMSINRNFEDFDKEVEWPSNKLCKETAPDFPKNIEAIFPIFMPFENKGIRMRSLLTAKLGVPLTEEFELPWHPPTCAPDRDRDAAATLKKSKQQLSTDVVDTGYLRLKLLEYVSDGDVAAVRHMQDAEIGQRIYAATKQKLAPKWILLTLSSLYWRVRNNNVNALHCLLTAGRWVPQRYRDVVLVSMASVYLEMGHFDEALVLAEESFRISLYEPATNFLLAELNMLKKHRNTHMFHLKQVVRVEPSFMNGHARNLLNAWACILKQVNALRELDFGEGDICTHVPPFLNMVCEEDGENCQMTNIQCFSSRERETSTLVRLLQDKHKVHVDSTESTFFDRLIETTPADKADRLEHHANFDNMVRTIETVLKGCGSAGCESLTPEDLDIIEEDCNYQHLQLGYWLHIVSFRQLLTDSDVDLPSEITSITPSSKKVPECRMTEDPLEDFYAEKLARVNTEGWEPVLSLMHQFSEIFDYFDYGSLGAKIAKYVETHASSWAGALAAGWWCGAGGRGACAARCLAAARALAPPRRRHHATRALAALLHMQSKQKDAKDVAYLSFYMAPKSKVEAFLVAVSHAFLAEYDQAIWMYRYALSLDDKFMPAKACLHATMCLMFYGDNKGKSKEE